MSPTIRCALACMLLLCIAMPLMPQSVALSLEEAYALTRKSSEALRLKELSLQKSRLALDEAGSRAWPHVDFQASASYLARPPQGYTVPKGSLGSIPYPDPPATPVTQILLPPDDLTIGAQQHNYFTATASLSQPIFTWGKIRNAIGLAALGVDAAGTELVSQQREIDREVHRAYFGALLAGESESVLKRIRDTAAEMASERQSSFDKGTINRENVLEAQSALASIEAKLAEAGQSRATALESLGILTGLAPSAITLMTEFRTELPAVDEQTLRARAQTSSVALATSRTRLSQARKLLSVEKGGSLLLPDVSLGMRLELSGQEDIPAAAWNWDNGAWDWDLVISLGMKMSVFDGLSSLARIRQAEKDLETAATALSLEEKLLGLDVRKAIDAAVKADADVKEKEARAAYAAERLKNARVSFDSGMASREDLQGADILAGSATLDMLLARYSREEALADIARITGERI
jgi:outer membrane protein TolC